VLGDLAIPAADDAAVLGEDERGRAGGAFVEREDVAHRVKVSLLLWEGELQPPYRRGGRGNGNPFTAEDAEGAEGAR
jgi:hypothetical protein